MPGHHSLLLTLLLLLLLASFSTSLPLSTSGRWIVDSTTGHRVKLRCVNWVAHMESVLPEGLDKQPLATITALTASLGFNCYRLTYATQLFTNMRYENMTVAASLGSLGLTQAVAGVRRNNPSMAELTVRQAYEEVVRGIGAAGLMAVLDNHVSKPQWCCGWDDGNGFFGDRFFDVEEWLLGLHLVATRFRGFPQVVGMSMRNELRGPKQNQPAWYTNVARGATTIHTSNPNVLIIISGLSFDTDLRFLAQHPLTIPYPDKLVLEAHWYAFSRNDWGSAPPTSVCSDSSHRFHGSASFVTESTPPTPLFISEFGFNQRNTSLGEYRYLSCIMAFAAEKDLDWALWALQGSYYSRNQQAGFEETFGVLDINWAGPKNPRFRERFGLLQEKLIEPGSNSPAHQILYHPGSGRCAGVDRDANVVLVDCGLRKKWSYEGDGKPIRLLPAMSMSGRVLLCVRADTAGSPVRLSAECEGAQSGWSVVGGFQMGGFDGNGKQLCLDVVNSSVVVANACNCVNGSIACDQNSLSQWFRVVNSNL